MESDRWINAPYAFNKIGRQLVAGGFSGNDYKRQTSASARVSPPTRCPQERDQGPQGSADVRAGGGMFGLQRRDRFLQSQIVAINRFVRIADGGTASGENPRRLSPSALTVLTPNGLPCPRT